MNGKDQKNIYTFLKGHKLGVLSTMDKNRPEAAVVDFSENPALEIIFTTLASYRKYKNLQKNSRIAFVVGGEENVTLQYEGVAEELSRSAFKAYYKRHIQKNPVEKKFAAMSEARFFKVRPTWLRFSDFTAQPSKIFEVEL